MWRYMTEKSNPPNDTLSKHYIICDERYNDHRRGYDYETMKDSRRVDMYVEFKDDPYGTKYLGKRRSDIDDEVVREYEE